MRGRRGGHPGVLRSAFAAVLPGRFRWGSSARADTGCNALMFETIANVLRSKIRLATRHGSNRIGLASEAALHGSDRIVLAPNSSSWLPLLQRFSSNYSR